MVASYAGFHTIDEDMALELFLNDFNMARKPIRE
jgi:hypothetical protein